MDQFLRILKAYPVAIGSLIPIIVGLYFLSSAKNEIEAAQAQVTDLNTQYERMLRNIENSEGLEEDVEQAEAIIAQIQDRLYDPTKQNEYNRFFYDQERREDRPLNVDRNGPNYPGKGIADPYERVTYSFEVTGTIENIISFIESIRTDRFTGVVSGYNIEPVAGDPSRVRVSFTIQYLSLPR